MIIDLPPDVEQMIIHQAFMQNISVSALIEHWAKQNKPQDDMLLIDFFKQNPPIEIFNDIDPVAYQRAIRDEW